MIIEKKKKFIFIERKVVVLIALFILLLTLILSYSLNIFPGGYSLEESNNKITLKKGLLQNEVSTYEITKNNEVKVVLLTIKINELKMKWHFYIAFLIVSSIFLYQKFYRLKHGKAVSISILLFLTVLVSVSYFNTLADIEQIISLL